MKDAAGNNTYYVYDSESNLTSISDADGHTTNFAYNSMDWLTQTTFPSGLMEAYQYDAVGSLKSKTDRKQQTINYTLGHRAQAPSRSRFAVVPSLPSA